MKLIDKALLFTLKQRVNELQRAIKRTPDSNRNPAREAEIDRLILEIKELEKK